MNYKPSYKNDRVGVNPEINTWELETPRVVRAEALRDLSKGYKECLHRLEEGTLDKFELHFKCKKDKHASMVINKDAPSLNENGVVLFNKLLPVTLKVGTRTRNKWFGSNQRLAKLWNNEYDIRLVTDGYKYWLNFPVKVKNIKSTTNTDTVAADPGLTTFQTCYSSREVATCHERNWNRVEMLQKKLDGLRSALSAKRITKCVFSRRYNKWSSQLEGMRDNLHWETIKYMTSNYKRIFLRKPRNAEK